jgi:hypothetical protein
MFAGLEQEMRILLAVQLSRFKLSGLGIRDKRLVFRVCISSPLASRQS